LSSCNNNNTCRPNNKSLCWDVTVTSPLAESYVTGSAREADAAAELAASHKDEKYASIGSECLFAPIAVETLGLMNEHVSLPTLCQSVKKDLLGLNR